MLPEVLATRTITAIPFGMAKSRNQGGWPFGKKLKAWLVEHEEDLPAFAKRAGIPYGSLHAYVTTERKIPSDRMQKVALATRLSADYWNSDLQYPPPAIYGADAVEAAWRRIQALPADLLNEYLALVEDPDDLRRTLQLRRTARGYSAPPGREPRQ